MNPWSDLSASELAVLDLMFWSPGLSRDTVSTRAAFSKTRANSIVASLLDQGIIEETGPRDSTGGRRAETIRLHRGLGVVLGVDLDATRFDVAVMTPDLHVLARQGDDIDVRRGPGLVLARVRAAMRELLDQCGADPRQVLGIGIGVPGPVNFEAAELVAPPLMPEWDGFSIRADMRSDYAAPIFVDNDVNLMALGELWHLRRTLQNFLVIKVSTGIGCGIVCHGEVYRGANGSAGDVGHICVDSHGPRCHCGNIGCVEAMAAGPAIARMGVEAALSGESAMLAGMLAESRAAGPDRSIDFRDVAQASRAGDVASNMIIQRAGGLIGQMLASVVNFFNPSHVFIGGPVARVGPLLLASVRQSVYQRSLALSTRNLEIQYMPSGEDAALIGAGVLAMREAMKGWGRDLGRGWSRARGFQPEEGRA
jgi:predicted NBD/HSP70 family sugar kinase